MSIQSELTFSKINIKIFYRIRRSRTFSFQYGKVFDDLGTAIYAREDRRRSVLNNQKQRPDGLFRIHDSHYRLISITRDELMTYIDRESNIEVFPVSIPEADGADCEIAKLIENSIFDHSADELAGFCLTQWSNKIVTLGKQQFAVFGSIAYELLPFDTAGEDGTEYEYRPVFCGGKMFRVDPDEGSGGMLYLMRRTMKNHVRETGGWMTTTLQGGWMYTNELDMLNEQIMNATTGA